MEWITEDKKQFFLSEPGKALAEWAANYSYTLNENYAYYSGLKDDEITASIQRECQKSGWK